MKTTYLEEFEKLADNKVAYIPIGTIEWHGNYLPIETDFLIAEKICKNLSDEFSGYVLPPLYLGAYGGENIDGNEMRGMDRKLKKKLAGNLYFLESGILLKILKTLIDNLREQGFSKIIIVTGHGGSNQESVLEKIAEDEKVLIINPYAETNIHHADEGEISVFWACFNEDEVKARSMPKDDDLSNYYGYDPLQKSSLTLGNRYLSEMLKSAKEETRKFLTMKTA